MFSSYDNERERSERGERNKQDAALREYDGSLVAYARVTDAFKTLGYCGQKLSDRILLYMTDDKVLQLQEHHQWLKDINQTTDKSLQSKLSANSRMITHIRNMTREKALQLLIEVDPQVGLLSGTVYDGIDMQPSKPAVAMAYQVL